MLADRGRSSTFRSSLATSSRPGSRRGSLNRRPASDERGPGGRSRPGPGLLDVAPRLGGSRQFHGSLYLTLASRFLRTSRLPSLAAYKSFAYDYGPTAATPLVTFGDPGTALGRVAFLILAAEARSLGSRGCLSRIVHRDIATVEPVLDAFGHATIQNLCANSWVALGGDHQPWSGFAEDRLLCRVS
jgi:hypothetical protein